jgi:hypothetical protein
LENLTESIPNTPTSWRDYDPTSISGSGIARGGTPASNRWSDEDDYEWNHQTLKLNNNKDPYGNSTATTPGLTEDGDDYAEFDNNEYGSESNNYVNEDYDYEGDPYDEFNEDDY